MATHRGEAAGKASGSGRQQKVTVDTGSTGCGRWVPNRGACALTGGHDGKCVAVEGSR